MRASPFLAAVAAASLLAGAAVAQETPAQPNMSSTAGRDSTGAPPATTSAGTTMQSGTASDAKPMTPPASDPSMSSGAMAPAPAADSTAAMPAAMPMAASAMTANTPGGDAPSSYPVCTKKGQDRCRQTGRHK